MDELYLKLTELYNRRNSLLYSDKEFIKTIYFNEFNGRISKTCNQAYTDAITHILIKLRSQNKKITIMEISNYSLKNGVIINSPDYGIIANNNITDEVAEKYLKNFPHQINKFATYPKDWQDRVSKNSQEQLLTVEEIDKNILAHELEIEKLQTEKNELLKNDEEVGITEKNSSKKK